MTTRFGDYGERGWCHGVYNFHGQLVGYLTHHPGEAWQAYDEVDTIGVYATKRQAARAVLVADRKLEAECETTAAEYEAMGGYPETVRVLRSTAQMLRAC